MENNHKFFLVLGAFIGFFIMAFIGFNNNYEISIIFRNSSIGALVGFLAVKILINSVELNIIRSKKSKNHSGSIKKILPDKK